MSKVVWDHIERPVQKTSTDAKLEGTRLAVSVVGLLNSFNYKLNDTQLLEVIQLCERLAEAKR